MSTQQTQVLRVVIIDDTVDLRDLLRIALTRGGMSVVGEAGDGLAGIESVRENNPDVILLDLSMPVMDGLEALPHLRALAPTARIIVFSGFGANQMAERALEEGADGYLPKGASLGRVLDYIRDTVAGRTVAPARSAPVNGAAPAAPAAIGADGRPLTHPSARDADSVPWDVLAQAPIGIIEVDAEPPYRLRRLNVVARDLLEYAPMPPGVPLAVISGELAQALNDNRLRGDVDFQATTEVQAVHVSLRHSGASLLIYLSEISDEVGDLRSAIATTAHEIRGPVAVLCGIAETLTSVSPDELDPALNAKMMASIGRQSRMLDSITADLLTAAQIQRGTLRLEARPVDPLSVIETLIQDRYPDSVAIVANDRRPVMADLLRLEQMIGNLLSNAHKYGRPPVVVRTRSEADHPERVFIDVIDAGVGVAPEFEAQLFREFSRATGTFAAGTGLGLHVVRTLAEAHGGAVSYSDAPGGGAVFTLDLPAA